MKALISTNEVFTWIWVTSWKWGSKPTPQNPTAQGWIPDTIGTIENCQRVAQVEPDDKTFPVYHTLIWVDCPDDCVMDEWYYKDGVLAPKPQDVPQPKNPPEA